MKSIFVFPPVWTKKSPSTGISAISGYLKYFGYDSEIIDLNIDFYDKFLNDENYNNAFDYIMNLSKSDSALNNENEILKIFHNNQKIYTGIKNKINESVKIVRTEQFYDSRKYKIAFFIIAKAIELISLKDYPFVIHDEKIINHEKEMQYEDYKNEAQNNKNIFYKFLKSKALEIVEKKPDYVGISINFEGQMLAGLTLAHILKSEYKIKVALGGTHITRSMEIIMNDLDFFDKYTDFVTIGEGEIPNLKLIQMLEGKCSPQDVPSLIYKEDNSIKSTPLLTEQVNLDYWQDFSFTKNKKYYLPETVYPINISKGCYWGKCRFCDFSLQYTHKPLNRIINEIKYLKKEYNAKYFYLTDAALSPKTAKEFAELLIQEKLDIRYTTFLRFEKIYDKKFLKLLYKSGLRCVSWGLESASQKVLDLMNKGTNIDTIKRILKDSSEIGIANRLTIIYLFPGENFEDFCETVDFLKNNRKYIFYVTFHRYVLKRYSYVFNHMEDFGIHLSTDEMKSEYQTFELGIPYNHKKLQELTSIAGGIYQNPDETLLYYSYFEKQHKNLLTVFSNLLRRQ